MIFSLILSSDDAFQFHADPCQFIPSENNLKESLRLSVISSDNQQCCKRHDTMRDDIRYDDYSYAVTTQLLEGRI